MADIPFRVLLDLTDLHIENFKYVWMNVSPRELKTISDFRIALLRKISIEREDIKLFVRDGLLLEQETIAILREDDTVKVQYEESSQLFSASNSAKESKRKYSRKRNCSEYNNDDNHLPLNKRKCKVNVEISKDSTESSFLEMSSEKQTKHEKSLNPVSFDSVIDDSENIESNYTKLQCQKKKDRKKSTTLGTNITESNLSQKCESFFSFNTADTTAEQCENTEISEKIESCNVTFCSAKKSLPNTISVTHPERSEMNLSESFEQSLVDKKAEVNNCPKKKRKRHKKRKKTASTVNEVSCDTDAKVTSFSDNMDEDVKRKHIVYSPVPCEKDSLLTSEKSNGVQDSPKDTFVISKNISTASTQSFKDYPKVSTPTLDGSCGNPSWQVSLMQSRNFVYNKELPSQSKEIMYDKPVVKTVSLKNSEKNNCSSEMQYDELPAVNSVPEIGTSIAYKTLELDESYSPVISKYREGVIKNINPDTQEVEIELLKHVIKPGRTGKFENLKPDESPLPDIKKYDIVRWSDVISPKHLSD